VAGEVNSLLFVRNDTTAEVWINGVSQGAQTIGNSLPTDDTHINCVLLMYTSGVNTNINDVVLPVAPPKALAEILPSLTND
jgi:hypothetical protein